METIPAIFFRYFKLFGILAILLSVATWALDIAGIVYVCPYCRTERTVIGLLGILMLMPNPRHWLVRYWAMALGVLGLVVGATQHFGGWRRISAGEFTFGADWYFNAFLLSGLAVLIIVGQMMLIHEYRAPLADAAK